MQSFLFRKVELWAVLLMVLLALLGVLWFAAEVRDSAQALRPEGRVQRAALAVASMRDTFEQILSEPEPLAVSGKDRFAGRSGWTAPGGGVDDPGYLLLSRTDGAGPTAVVDLVRLKDLAVMYHWAIDPTRVFAEPDQDEAVEPDEGMFDRTRFRLMHPLLTADGKVVFHGQTSPLVAADACGAPLWRTDDLIYHHSLNIDADGNFWAPAKVAAKGELTNANGTHEALAKVGPDGRLLWSKSVPELLTENGMTYLVYHAYERTGDPLHLNDVQPVLADGPYWQKGDLLLSLRTPSMILLYRPSTGKVIWSKAGPWIHQHDVDIIDDHRISVFDNNVQDRGRGQWIDGSSHVRIYDLADGSVTAPLETGEDAARVLAVNNGLADRTANGMTMIEEDTAGRILILGPAGEQLAEFVNRAPNGKLYRMGWSRYVDAATGAAALAHLDATQCGG